MAILTLIVDDEPLARKNLAFLLKPHTELEIVAECANGIQALQAIDEHRPHVLFLDVQMPTMNGLEVLAAIPESQMPLIIFTTAFDEYATKAFEYNAVDYLLKPISEDRLNESVARVQEKHRNQRSEPLDPSLQKLIQMLDLQMALPVQQESLLLKRLMVKDNQCFVYVDLDDIDFLEAAGNYVAIHVANKTHLIRETLSNIETRLDAEAFIRVSRSQLLNIKQVSAFEPHFQGEFIAHLKRGAKVKMNRRFRNNWAHLFNDAYS